MTRKAPQPEQPNIRDALTTAFIEQLQKDFAEHGKEIIQKVREEAPSKYAELVLRLIPLEPRMLEAHDKPKTSEDLARHLLRDHGLTEPTDQDIEETLLCYDRMNEALEFIVKRAMQ